MYWWWVRTCSSLSPSDIPEKVFFELMKFATSSVEFSFDNIMYWQIEGVALGSLLGPALANIFVGFHKVRFALWLTLSFYCIASVCGYFLFMQWWSWSGSISLLSQWPWSSFEVYAQERVLFWTGLFGCTGTLTLFLTSPYRKSSFICMYTHWDSFCPKKWKINLIKTLMHRALMICSEVFFHNEIDFVTRTM